MNLKASSTLRLALGLGVGAAALATATQADALNFSFDVKVFSPRGVAHNPSIYLRFAPDPDAVGVETSLRPDAEGRTTLTAHATGTNRFLATVAVRDRDGTPFSLQYPPDPCRAGEDGYPPDPCRIPVLAVAADGTVLLVNLDVSSANGPINPGTARGFNPQPDPPGFPTGGSVSFSIPIATSDPSVTATLVPSLQSAAGPVALN